MCFSLAWIENLLIWFVIICAIVAVLKILVPWVVAMMGVSINTGPLIPILRIIVIAFIVIWVIVFVFDLLGCLMGSGGGLGFPRLVK